MGKRHDHGRCRWRSLPKRSSKLQHLEVEGPEFAHSMPQTLLLIQRSASTSNKNILWAAWALKPGSKHCSPRSTPPKSLQRRRLRAVIAKFLDQIRFSKSVVFGGRSYP